MNLDLEIHRPEFKTFHLCFQQVGETRIWYENEVDCCLEFDILQYICGEKGKKTKERTLNPQINNCDYND